MIVEFRSDKDVHCFQTMVRPHVGDTVYFAHRGEYIIKRITWKFYGEDHEEAILIADMTRVEDLRSNPKGVNHAAAKCRRARV